MLACLCARERKSDHSVLNPLKLETPNYKNWLHVSAIEMQTFAQAEVPLVSPKYINPYTLNPKP